MLALDGRGSKVHVEQGSKPLLTQVRPCALFPLSIFFLLWRAAFVLPCPPCGCRRRLCRTQWLCVVGMEEIEFMQLMFREDFISDSYFGGNLRGVIATEELHFGEGMHRKAFRSRVMQGLVPVFSPGHPCVLKVHNAITYGTKSQDDLVEKNYNLALQVSSPLAA